MACVTFAKCIVPKIMGAVLMAKPRPGAAGTPVVSVIAQLNYAEPNGLIGHLNAEGLLCITTNR